MADENYLLLEEEMIPLKRKLMNRLGRFVDSKGGFTLMEVVLAMALFMIFSVTFYTVFNNAIKTISMTMYKSLTAESAAYLMYTDYDSTVMRDADGNELYNISEEGIITTRDDGIVKREIVNNVVYRCLVTRYGSFERVLNESTGLMQIDKDDTRNPFADFNIAAEGSGDTDDNDERGQIVRVQATINGEYVTYYYYRPFHPYSCSTSYENKITGVVTTVYPCSACTRKNVSGDT